MGWGGHDATEEEGLRQDKLELARLLGGKVWIHHG